MHAAVRVLILVGSKALGINSSLGWHFGLIALALFLSSSIFSPCRCIHACSSSSSPRQGLATLHPNPAIFTVLSFVFSDHVGNQSSIISFSPRAVAHFGFLEPLVGLVARATMTPSIYGIFRRNRLASGETNPTGEGTRDVYKLEAVEDRRSPVKAPPPLHRSLPTTTCPLPQDTSPADISEPPL